MRFLAAGIQLVALVLVSLALVIDVLATFASGALTHTADLTMRAALRVAKVGLPR